MSWPCRSVKPTPGTVSYSVPRPIRFHTSAQLSSAWHALLCMPASLHNSVPTLPLGTEHTDLGLLCTTPHACPTPSRCSKGFLTGRGIEKETGINFLESYQTLSSPFIGTELQLGTSCQERTTFLSAHGTKLSPLDTEQKRHMSLKTPPCSFWIPVLVSSSSALGHEAGS